MCKRISVCAMAYVMILCPLVLAQEYPRADVFGGYSYLNIDTNGLTSRQSANGWEAGAAGNFNRWFGAEFDVSGYYKKYSVPVNTPLVTGTFNVSVRDYSYLAGPRANFRPLFLHALLGGDHLSGSTSGFSASQDGFAGAFGGGVQQKISGPWGLWSRRERKAGPRSWKCCVAAWRKWQCCV